MGVLIMHEWATLLALVSGAYAVWAGIWAIVDRKFFWDMIGGSLSPNGIIPGPNSAFFIQVIVNVPVIQILNIINGLATLALEWPLPFLAGTAVHRSFVVRIVLYLWCALCAALPYQTIDAGIFYLVTIGVYARAISLGELMPEAKANKGSVGMA